MNAGGDIREDRFIVGREREILQAVEQLRRGRNVLFTGEKGMGKTRIMNDVMEKIGNMIQNGRPSEAVRAGGPARPSKSVRAGGEDCESMYVWRCGPMGDMLREICARLHRHEELRTDALGEVDANDWGTIKKKLTGLGTAGVQNMIIDSLAGSKRHIIFFDSLDRMTAAYQPFMERILAHATVCAGVVNPQRKFAKIWASFSKIQLLPLSDEDATRLINHLLDTYSIHLIDRRMYVRQLIKAANGNPFHIKTMLWHGSLERRLGEEEIRALQRVEQGELLNMGPAYIFGASAFTLYKIFSMGTDRDEFYVYFSALGFLVYMTFRVFRNFFLFRPQRFREQ